MSEAYVWPRVVQLWGQGPSPHVQPRILPTDANRVLRGVESGTGILPVDGAPSPPT